MQFYWLAVGIMGCWRITHLLQAEDGPWEMFDRLRRRAGNSFAGKALGCFYCSSLWVALPIVLALGDSWIHSILLWPAISGGAILLERATTRPAEIAPPIYYEEQRKEEDHDGLLRAR